MRPISLRIQAFGSYPGEERVDFSALAHHGLFVVAGPTGSGKTTLFDALAYALYGDLPAGRPDDVRSHHADPSTLTEIELDFEVDGRRYRVLRRPRQQQPKKRGAGFTVVAAGAELHEITATGPRAIASGPRDVTAWCEDLVGLTAAQFDRVVLLPQGKFSQFLLSTTNERRPILQQLFGTHLYSSAVELLKERTVELRGRLGDADAEERHFLANAHAATAELVEELAPAELDLAPDAELDAVEAVLAELSPLLGATRAAAIAGSTAADAAGVTAGLVEAVAARWDHRAELHQRRAQLESDRPSVDRDRFRLEAARRAGPVDAAAQRAERAVEALDVCSVALAAARADAGAALGAAGLDAAVDAVNDAMASVGRRKEALRARSVRLDEWHTARAELDRRLGERQRSEAALAAVAARSGELATALAQATSELADVVPVADELVERRLLAEHAGAAFDRRVALERDDEQAAGARKPADESSARAQELNARFLAGAAPRLAALLTPGAPCSVCGSTQHPAPAAAGAGAPVDVDAVDRALDDARAAEAHAAALAAHVHEHITALGPRAYEPVDAFASARDAAAERLRAAEEAGARAVVLRARIGALEAEARELANDREELAGAALAAGLAVAHADEILQAITGELDGLDRATLDAQIEAVDAAERCVRAVDRCERAADGASVTAEAALRDLAAAVDASEFTDVAEARAAWLAGDECKRIEQSIGAWERADHEVATLLDQLAGEDLPEERPDAEVERARAEHLRRLATEAAAHVTRLAQRFDDAQGAVEEGRAAAVATAALRASYETAARVSATCDGRGPGRIGLETWVLAGELERVSDAANVHLHRMTGGRYRLLRSDTAEYGGRRAGLDLRVLDSHTGRERSPGSLSGGEQFQASLALALGLADVVSQGGSGSGRVFEALFVDEGFGSLDADALDDAIDALHQLRSTGRMIGVITHVEAMKQQLPVGIEVRRRPDGAGSTLRSA